MPIHHKIIKNQFPDMQASIAELNGTKINVGCLEGEHAWLASIHEYGCNIKPKNGGYLTVPCCKEAYQRSARSFPDLFVYTAKSGTKWLARKKGNSIQVMYALMKSVKIPERAFLRGGFDAHAEDVIEQAEAVIGDVINGAMSVDLFSEMVGQLLSSQIKEYAIDLKSPPKSPMTIASENGKSNPLVDTGDMIGSITYEVTK